MLSHLISVTRSCILISCQTIISESIKIFDYLWLLRPIRNDKAVTRSVQIFLQHLASISRRVIILLLICLPAVITVTLLAKRRVRLSSLRLLSTQPGELLVSERCEGEGSVLRPGPPEERPPVQAGVVAPTLAALHSNEVEGGGGALVTVPAEDLPVEVRVLPAGSVTV